MLKYPVQLYTFCDGSHSHSHSYMKDKFVSSKCRSFVFLLFLCSLNDVAFLPRRFFLLALFFSYEETLKSTVSRLFSVHCSRAPFDQITFAHVFVGKWFIENICQPIFFTALRMFSTMSTWHFSKANRYFIFGLFIFSIFETNAFDIRYYSTVENSSTIFINICLSWQFCHLSSACDEWGFI